MRWYCVHPSLPLQAELRIRTAPDSSASERARVSQGRAIGACSPVFEVPGDGVDAASVSWLQVAYQDAVSGEIEGGFMMADLPDGMALLTPWETTDFLGCCEVSSPTALMFDGPQDTAESLGPVQSINFLYCIVEGSEARLRLFHPELESVWVEKKDVQIVCTRLQHDACTTPHTFYELNEALPEEAQIAIREFPSKEAQAVGLLSRGETLEVIIRGGNWLQIAGGTLDKAWIMWRTDSLELLQEASDVSSDSCQPVQLNFDGLPHEEVQEDQVYRGGTSEETEATAAAIVPGTDVEASAGPANDDASTSAIAIAATIVEPADPSRLMSESQSSAAVIGHTEAWDDRPIQPARVAYDEEDNGDAETSTTVIAEDDVAAASSEVDVCAEHAASVQEVHDWDDRPIRPASARHNKVESAVVDISVTRDDEAPVQTSYEVSGDCMDQCPFQPAQVGNDEAEYDDVTFATVVAKQFDLEENTSDIEVAKPWNGTSIEPRINVTDDIPATFTVPAENDMAASGDGGDEALKVDTRTESLWDDRPIRPARNICTGECSAGDSRFTVDGEAEEDVPADARDHLANRSASTVADDAGDNDAVTIVLDAVAVGGMEPVQNVELWDDRPIRPAQTQLDELELEDDIVVVQDAAADDIVSAAPSSEEHVGVVQSCDDRPIKPASTFLETRADSVLNVADDAVAAVDNDSSSRERAAYDGDEERDRTQSWDDRLITTAPVALVAPGTVTAAAIVESNGAIEEDRAVHSTAEVAANETTGDNEGGNISPCDDAKEADDVQTSLSSDDRPIRPAQSVAVDEGCGTTAEAKEDDAVDAPTLAVDDVGGNHDKEDMEGLAVSNIVDDRTIRPPAGDAGVLATDDACAGVVKSKFDASFAEREALEKVGVSFESPVYSDGEAKSEPMSSSEAGDIAVLGGLDDVFDPVDELIMDIREDMEKDVRRCESNLEEESDESVRGGGEDAAISSASVAQTTPNTEGVDQSVAFLQEFGVIKYCEQKQSLYPPSDKLSLAMFSADQDDADLVFEVLVGDDPLSDDWFHDVASRGPQAKMFSSSTALAASGDAVVRSTYDLIMGNGSPEDILEAELSSDNEGDFDLVVCFKYPSPQRRVIEPSRASSPFRRVPSAPSRMAALEASAESSPSKPASENEFEAEDSLLMPRQPSPPSQLTPAHSPLQPATKATSPPKNVLPGPPKISTSTRSRLTQRSQIVTPSSIGKPPSALSRPRSFIQSSHLATPTRSAITKTSSPSLAPPPEASASSVAASGASPSRAARPLLQRRSFLATPSPSKALGVSSSTRNSMTGSILKPTEVSGLQAPRKSFGFRRPSGLAKKT